jgi:ubiquitin-small subunit ribosomal protein S27Ae
MAKARVGLYQASGETLTRTHRACPNCGAGVFLAEHADRRSCGKCGFTEPKGATAPAPRPPKA